MNKNTLPDDTKIACCKACLLSSTMRDCKACPFNIGLLHKSLDLLAQDEPITSLAPSVRAKFIHKINEINDTVSTS